MGAGEAPWVGRLLRAGMSEYCVCRRVELSVFGGCRCIGVTLKSQFAHKWANGSMSTALLASRFNKTSHEWAEKNWPIFDSSTHGFGSWA